MQLQHLPRDTFKFYLKHRDKFLRDATTHASPSMLKHLSSYITLIKLEFQALFLRFTYFELRNIYKRFRIHVRIPISIQ